MAIHVFGSLNLDLVCTAPRLPRAGETLLGSSFSQAPGGKGANQAVAAAKLGAPTRLVGRVGRDGFSAPLLQSLQKAGVDISGIEAADAATGIAAIVVDEAGQNQIVVVPGANDQVGQADVERLLEPMRPGDWLLLQLEIPMEAVVAAAVAARQRQVRVMLDPAPAAMLPPELLAAVDILTPNQQEASQLVGLEVCDSNSAASAARQLRQRVDTVIIKLGAAGVWVETVGLTYHQSPFSVTVKDTVAAGDAFNAALAVALSQSLDLRGAVEFASAAAALCVSRTGAQGAMATLAEVQQLQVQNAASAD